MFVTLNLSSLKNNIDDSDLERLAKDNPETLFETDAEGQLIFMSPTGGETGARNSDLLMQVAMWNKQSKLGKVFDSSTGFKLSNAAVKSPDVSWITIDSWDSLTKKQRRKFLPINPDFVIELVSPTDELVRVQNKMAEYISCGVKLGWLINPDVKQVEIYRQNKPIEILENPKTLLGENIMPDLIVDFSEIFN